MFLNLERHVGYRDSGILWLPTIPAHWGSERLKTIVTEIRVKGFPDEPLLAATQSRGVILKKDYEARTVEAQKSLETLKLVEVDDFVISLRSFQGGIERAYARGIISPAYTVLQAVKPEDRDYLALLFKSIEFIDALKLTITGIREGQNIDYARLAPYLMPVPPEYEQAAIVKYLGHAHARIDRAIDAKRRLIVLLEEQRQTIMHRAVTRGLDPTVPFKSTGIAWFGEIPAHWEVRRAKYLFKEFDNRSGTGLERLLSLRALAGLVFHDEVSDKVIGPEVLTKYKKVGPGHLVMNRMRAASGLFAIASTDGLVSPDYATMEVAEVVDARFYLRLFKTRAAMTQFRQQSTGLGTGESGFMRLYSEAFGRIPMPIPPLEEQMEISDELARLEQEGNETTNRVSREIELLREFRTRLTSDVVTGQVDVREIVETLSDLSGEVLAASEDELPESDSNLSELEFAGTDE
ncbi:restriction endonuclease subunit S [Cryobacterium sp. TMT2-14]|uniref:restriction endonuclease subunit S n=1 Tax=Cryobacterium sp. TMT2-14 TaxID=1259245 RepID=UPI00106CCFDA|nr:restriction endonuclease subunit S [Cryobacterium sp. TMT2-14]TFC38985.1 restriction endonuclease subunit S [Cryobacterium sp. TMT2-14]